MHLGSFSEAPGAGTSVRRGASALGFLKSHRLSKKSSEIISFRLPVCAKVAWISWDSPSQHLQTPAGVRTRRRTRFDLPSSPSPSFFLGGGRGSDLLKPPQFHFLWVWHFIWGRGGCKRTGFLLRSRRVSSHGGKIRPLVFPLQLESSPRWGYLFSLPFLFLIYFFFSSATVEFPAESCPTRETLTAPVVFYSSFFFVGGLVYFFFPVGITELVQNIFG